MSETQLSPEEHRTRHVELHRMLDELVLEQMHGSIHDEIFQLMNWSYQQTRQPTVNAGSLTQPRPVPHA